MSEEQGDNYNDVDVHGEPPGMINLHAIPEMIISFRTCPACWIRPRSTMYLPCYHVCHCDECANSVPVCLMCNTPVRAIICVTLT